MLHFLNDGPAPTRNCRAASGVDGRVYVVTARAQYALAHASPGLTVLWITRLLNSGGRSVAHRTDGTYRDDKWRDEGAGVGAHVPNCHVRQS